MPIDDYLETTQRRKTSNTAFNVGVGIGATAVTYTAVGIDGLTVPPTYTLAEYVTNKNFTSTDFRNEMIVGSIQTVTTVYPAYKFMNYAQPAIESAIAEAGHSSLAYLAGWGARAVMNVGVYLPLVIFNYYVASYLVKRRTIKGLYKNAIKPNFKKDVVRAYKWLGIPIMLAATIVPPSFHILTSAILRFAFRSLLGKKSKERNSGINKVYYPQLSAA